MKRQAEGAADAPAAQQAKTEPPATLMYKTLNVTDSTWTVPYPHLGSIGHVLDFPTACRVAQEHGFRGVNLDVDYLKEHGAAKVGCTDAALVAGDTAHAAGDCR